MDASDRRAAHRGFVRKAILDATRELIVLEGHAQISMRKIARRIQLSATTIYLHFRDKDDLIDALCEETFSHLQDRLRTIEWEAGDPLAALRRGMKAYVEFGLENPQHYAVAFMSGAPVDAGSPPYPRRTELSRNIFDLLRRTVAACMETGQVRQADVEMTSRSLWAAMHGLTSLLIANPAFPWGDRETLIDSHVALQLDGLRPIPE